MINGKTIALTIWTFVIKVMSLLSNMLCWFVIAFLPSYVYISCVYIYTQVHKSETHILMNFYKMQIVMWPILAHNQETTLLTSWKPISDSWKCFLTPQAAPMVNSHLRINSACMCTSANWVILRAHVLCLRSFIWPFGDWSMLINIVTSFSLSLLYSITSDKCSTFYLSFLG